DYFFDGSSGLLQKVNNTAVWIYPTQRRGGRMVYGMDVTDPNTIASLWYQGCDNNLMSGGTCTSGFSNIGQTWSTPVVTKIKGYDYNATLTNAKSVVIVGGGYDTCEDQNVKNPTCTNPKGAYVYIMDALTGNLLATFPTKRSVTADVSVVDINN